MSPPAGPVRVPPVESRPDPEYSSRGGQKIRAVVIHTTEGSSYEGVIGYLQRTRNSVSAHYVVSIEPRAPGATWAKVARMVPEALKAWTARSANPVTVNYELCGYARQTRTEWLTDRKVQLETVAALVAQDTQEYGIPIRRGYPGILGHGDLTRYGFPNDHTDPGAGFPWDHFLRRVTYHRGLADRPPKQDVKAGKAGRPKGAPLRIPRWAWQLHEWLLTEPAKRGPRPAGAPLPTPDWFWPWRAWRMGVPTSHQPAEGS